MMAPKRMRRKGVRSAFVCAFLGAQFLGVIPSPFPSSLNPPRRLRTPVPMPLPVGKCLGMGLAGLACGMPPCWANEGDTAPSRQIFLYGILFL